MVGGQDALSREVGRGKYADLSIRQVAKPKRRLRLEGPENREVASLLTGIEKSRKVSNNQVKSSFAGTKRFPGARQKSWGVLLRLEEQGLHPDQGCGRTASAQSDRKQCRTAYGNGEDSREGEVD